MIYVDTRVHAVLPASPPVHHTVQLTMALNQIRSHSRDHFAAHEQQRHAFHNVKLKWRMSLFVCVGEMKLLHEQLIFVRPRFAVQALGQSLIAPIPASSIVVCLAIQLTEQNGAAERECKQWQSLTLGLRRQC